MFMFKYFGVGLYLGILKYIPIQVFRSTLEYIIVILKYSVVFWSILL